MYPTKMIKHEVQCDLEEEINQWCYDSHLWYPTPEEASYHKCFWCGIAEYEVHDINKFITPCRYNPAVANKL